MSWWELKQFCEKKTVWTMKNNNNNKNKSRRIGPKPAPTPAQIQRKKARNAKRRQNRKQGVAKGMDDLRTPGTIIKNLAGMMKGMSLSNVSEYMMCRAKAIAPKMVPSIPDGNNGRHICVCAFKSDRLTWSGTGSKYCTMQINPWIPAPLFFQSVDTTTLFNGLTMPNAAVFQPGGVAPEFDTGIDFTRPGTTTIDPYFAIGFRIVAITVHITYTGPVTTAAGVLRATPNTFNLQDIGETTNTSASATAPTSGFALSRRNNTATIIGWANNNTPVAPLEGAFGFANGLSKPNTRTVRPEEGLIVRLKHRTGDFKLQPMRDQNIGVALRGSTSGAGAPVLVDNIFSETGTFGGGLRGFDNDWEGVLVTFENVNADASFIIDTCVCLEIQPSPTSTVYQFAKESVKPDLAAIKATQNYINENSIRTHRD